MASTAKLLERNIVAKRLTELRIKKGMTQAEMSRVLGVAYASYNQWENGIRIPRMQNLNALASKLGVPIAFFLGEDYEQNDLDITNSLPLLNGTMFVNQTQLNDVLIKGSRYNPSVEISSDKFCFKIRDHSMTRSQGQSINVGMTVVCTKKFTPEEIKHSISCISIRQKEAMIREINFDSGKVIVTPWNNYYDELIIPVGEIKVWGRVERAIEDF